MPKVSIIIPAYNGERFIGETLESLLGQTYHDFEIIAVDDGSTDATVDIIKSFIDIDSRRMFIQPLAGRNDRKCDSRVKYFHKENSGNQAIPRNFGIKRAKGEYIAFCDQDDLWYPEKLEKQMSAIDSRRSLSAKIPASAGMTEAGGNDDSANIGIIVASTDVVDSHGKKIGARYVPDGYMDSSESFRMLLEEDFITACSAVFPKKVLDEVGFLREDLSGNDDYDLWLRITRKYGVYGFSEPLCAWRRSKKSFSHDMSRVFKENEKIFKSLKAANDEEEKLIKTGANLNLVRLFIAEVKEKKYDEAGKVLERIRPYDGLFKAKVAMKVFKISPGIARMGLAAASSMKESR